MAGSLTALTVLSQQQVLWVLEPVRLQPPGSAPMRPNDEGRFQKQLQLAQYYNAQLRLYGRLAFQESYKCIAELRQQFSFDLLYAMLSNAPPLSPSHGSSNGSLCKVRHALERPAAAEHTLARRRAGDQPLHRRVPLPGNGSLTALSRVLPGPPLLCHVLLLLP